MPILVNLEYENSVLGYAKQADDRFHYILDDENSDTASL